MTDFRDGALGAYLREIGDIPLLTRADEQRLGKRIKRGDRAAREQMIRANLRLVVKIAHDYAGLGLPLLDLISEGNMGLMKGVERFDPDNPRHEPGRRRNIPSPVPRGGNRPSKSLCGTGSRGCRQTHGNRSQTGSCNPKRH